MVFSPSLVKANSANEPIKLQAWYSSVKDFPSNSTITHTSSSASKRWDWYKLFSYFFNWFKLKLEICEKVGLVFSIFGELPLLSPHEDKPKIDKNKIHVAMDKLIIFLIFIFLPPITNYTFQ